MALSPYVWLGGLGLAAIGVYAVSKQKAAAAAPAKTPPAGTPPPMPGGTAPGGLSLDWRTFGYDMGFGQGAKDKLSGGLMASIPEPPASELTKAGVDQVALKAGYADGYKAGWNSVSGPTVKGSWYGTTFVPFYWKPVPAKGPMAPVAYGPMNRSHW